MPKTSPSINKNGSKWPGLWPPNRRYLMLDELMAGLNPAEVTEAMELVTRIRAKGITIIMIEHVMKAIMGICDRIIVLNHGEKIAEGTPQEISTSQHVIEVYLGE